MGYNFSVRPAAEFGSNANFGKKYESQIDLDRQLLKMRKFVKHS